MGKGGGGGIDMSGMEDATRDATALQKEIYEFCVNTLHPSREVRR